MDLNTYYLFLRYLSDAKIPFDYDEKRLKYQTRHYMVQEGLLYKKNPRNPLRPQRVLKPHEIEAVLFSMHSDPLSGHFNVTATFQRISIRYFWPQMGESIKAYVKSCDSCQRRGRPKSKEPLHPIQVGRPFD